MKEEEEVTGGYYILPADLDWFQAGDGKAHVCEWVTLIGRWSAICRQQTYHPRQRVTTWYPWIELCKTCERRSMQWVPERPDEETETPP